MTIETSKGNKYEVKSIAAARIRGESRLMIEMVATMKEAAEALEGCEWIQAGHDVDGVVTRYEGFDRIEMIRRTQDGARVTLCATGKAE